MSLRTQIEELKGGHSTIYVVEMGYETAEIGLCNNEMVSEIGRDEI